LLLPPFRYRIKSEIITPNLFIFPRLLNATSPLPLPSIIREFAANSVGPHLLPN
jgi:hypothetical protein